MCLHEIITIFLRIGKNSISVRLTSRSNEQTWFVNSHRYQLIIIITIFVRVDSQSEVARRSPVNRLNVGGDRGVVAPFSGDA